MAYESPAVRDAKIDVGAVLGAVVRRLPRIILVTLLLLAATFVYFMFQPRLYESSASILVEPRSNIYTRSPNEPAPSFSARDAGVVSSQIELLKSRDTLIKVIDLLDLRSVAEFNGSGGGGGFSPGAMIGRLLGRTSAPTSVDETVLANLYDRMTVIQERDSAIISVLVRSTDPDLAARIANAVANAHVARRTQLSLSDTADASSWLRDEIAKLRVTVTEAETAVANFKVANDLYSGGNNTSLVDQQLSTVASQINAAQERQSTALSRAAIIRGMLERGQPIDNLTDVRQSPVIQQLGEEKARLQSERAQRSATLLDNHPTIRALDSQIAELNNQITIEGRRVADALEAEAQVEADVTTSLQGDLSRVKTSAGTATQDTVTLDALQREAKAQRDLLESYLQRYSEAMSRTESNSALPDVRVVSLAAPAVSPSSPRTQMVLIAVGIVSVAVQVGLIVFGELISGRAIIPGARPQDELDEVPFKEDELEPDQRYVDPEAEAVIEPEDATPPVTASLVAVEPTFEPTTAPVAPQPMPEAPIEETPVTRPSVSVAEAEAEIEAQRTVAYEDARARFMASLANDDAADHSEVQADAPRSEAAAQSAEPAHAEVRREPAPQHTVNYNELVSDLVLGRTHLVILAAHGAVSDSTTMAEELVGDALGKGLSVALIDAGSGDVSDEFGLTDLSADLASFGDVVHKSTDNSFAEVPWGQGHAIDRRSSKPLTLVEALGDIYEVVVLLTGRIGMASTLPMFGELDGRIVLVAGPDDACDDLNQARDELTRAGYGAVEIAAVPTRAAA